jgi:hypothetical protein
MAGGDFTRCRAERRAGFGASCIIRRIRARGLGDLDTDPLSPVRLQLIF